MSLGGGGAPDVRRDVLQPRGVLPLLEQCFEERPPLVSVSGAERLMYQDGTESIEIDVSYIAWMKTWVFIARAEAGMEE